MIEKGGLHIMPKPQKEKEWRAVENLHSYKLYVHNSFSTRLCHAATARIIENKSRQEYLSDYNILVRLKHYA